MREPLRSALRPGVGLFALAFSAGCGDHSRPAPPGAMVSAAADGGGAFDGGPAPPRHREAGGDASAAVPIAADAAVRGDAPPAFDAEAGSCARFATGVVDFAFGDGQNFGQDRFPDPILGPPAGGGCCQGSLDVVSLGNGGFVIVEFSGTAIIDGPGPDFIVFENPFVFGDNPEDPFAELATVAVSADGESWVEFSCTATAYPYDSCAGWHPVYANADTNAIDPLDPEEAGGDAFDLSEVGVAEARFVRITDREDLTGAAGVFDLDAVGIVNARCP